jgi:hypothetical protein
VDDQNSVPSQLHKKFANDRKSIGLKIRKALRRAQPYLDFTRTLIQIAAGLVVLVKALPHLELFAKILGKVLGLW